MTHPGLHVSRRAFLRAAVLGPLGLGAPLLGGCQGPPRDGATLRIVDTHTHFYDPRRTGGIPWPPADDPVLYRPVLPAEFRRLAEPLGVRGTLVVEASPRESDNDWVLGLASEEPFLLGLVGHLKPGRPGFAESLRRLAARPGFRGIRTGGWEVSLAPDDPAFRRDLARLSSLGLALDVLVGPDQLGQVARLAGVLPELRIVIDHCANLRVDGAPPPVSWRDGLRACARHDRVFMKVSGLVEGTGKTDGNAPAAVEFYRPVLDAIWEVFGEDRVIFGSNWPVSARFAPYATVLGIVDGYTRSLGGGAAGKYFAGNAGRVYGVRPG